MTLLIEIQASLQAKLIMIYEEGCWCTLAGIHLSGMFPCPCEEAARGAVPYPFLSLYQNGTVMNAVVVNYMCEWHNIMKVLYIHPTTFPIGCKFTP